MNHLHTIARDLVERRLWPFAALLAAVLVAVPVLFLRPGPAALQSAPAPAPVAAAAATGTTAPATTAAPADLGSDPSVGMTSSPFAAAFGAGTNLPPAMEGLLKSAKGPDDRKAVASSPLKNPFAVAASAAPPAASTTKTTTTAAAPATATPPSAGSAPAAPAQTVATPSLGAAKTTPATTPVSSVTKAIFHADVRFGTVETPPMVTDVRRLTAFPSSFAPVAVYLGVMRGGWGAAFALRSGVQPVGSPSCRPRKQICTWVILHPGESVTLNVKDDATGTVTPYKLTLERVRKTTVSPKVAQLAAQRVAVDGRCLLGPLAAYRYDTESGTLAPRPELKSCRYATPGSDGQAASVRIAHIG